MKTIANYLKIIRRLAIARDLKLLGWITYFFFIVLFLITMFAEALFYFSSLIRYSVWILAGLTVGLTLFWLGLSAFQLARNKINRYRWTTLARRVGAHAFDKEDTLINALQIERSLGKNSSAELGVSFVKQTLTKLDVLDLTALFPPHRIERWKNRVFALLFISLISIGITWKYSVSALYRWGHPKTEFLAPRPFRLTNLSGHIHLLGGESAQLDFQAIGSAPDSIQIELRSLVPGPKEDSIRIISISRSPGNYYRYDFTEIYHDYQYRGFVPAAHFWQPWDEISTDNYSISVTDRPIMETFSITVIAPAYAHLPDRIQKANQAEVQGLKGSTIALALSSNRPLASASLELNGKSLPLNLRQQRARGKFRLETEGQFTIHLKDTRGISNRNPIPYRLKLIPDLPPELNIIQPPPIIELGRNQTIPMRLTIEDDYGFSNLQVAYEIRRPSYFKAEPFISMFSIPLKDTRKLKQDINTTWDLSDLGLMPEDEVHYHFELYDNDEISGPKKYLSGTFIARLPSLNDLFKKFQRQEESVAEKVELDLKQVKKLKSQLKQAELELLKTDTPNWDQQKALKKNLEEVQQAVDQLQKLAEQMEILNKSGIKNDLFSKELLKKFNELQNLIEEVLPPELREKLQSVNQALENLDAKTLTRALSDLNRSLDQVERELDRFLDIFRRVQAEQGLDELREQFEQLTQQQDNLDRRIRETNDTTDPSTLQRLGLEEDLNYKTYRQALKSMERVAKNIKEYSPGSSTALKELADSQLADSTADLLTKTTRTLKRQDPRSAMQTSYAALKNLQTMEQSLTDVQTQFQREATADMAQKFRSILQNIFSLSKSQENLRGKTQSIPRNSPRLGKMAAEQQILQDQLAQTMGNLMNLSKETFMVSPEMGRGMGMAYAQMEAAKSKLGDRNGNGSLANQEQAMGALNETASTIVAAVQEMQSSGSTSGYQQFLQRMQEMSASQQGINEQGIKLALGQMTATMQQALMQKMLANQQAVRKALQQLMEELKQAGNQGGLRALSGISQELDKVLRDLEQGKYSRQTLNRQERILSRMLDSQKSLTQRGYEEQRKSKTGTQFTYSGPAGLPKDFGQRHSLILDAMNQALRSGYSQDYKTMIRLYFNRIAEATDTVIPDSGAADK